MAPAPMTSGSSPGRRFYGRTAHTIVFPESSNRRRSAVRRRRPRRGRHVDGHVWSGGFTLRHARIPAELAKEFTERVMDLATEFTRLPRGGTVNTHSSPGCSQPIVPSHQRMRE